MTTMTDVWLNDWLEEEIIVPSIFKETFFVKTEPSGNKMVQGLIQALPTNVVLSHPPGC